MKNEIIDLTSKLIAIPSWVDRQTDEGLIGSFIYQYLAANTALKLVKEPVTSKRFNIFAANSSRIKTLVIGHIDTVGIGSGWTTGPLIPVIKDCRLYGRGASDMKSGVAAMMLLAASPSLPPNTGFLFYVDEEYNFLGIKKFLADFGSKIKPKTVISLDGSDLRIANGCRGLIEIEGEIIGRSSHAANPENGISAIEAVFAVYGRLKLFLAEFNSPDLGSTSINLGLINGGTAANVVPGSCRFNFDIRPGTASLNAAIVTRQIQKQAKELKVKADLKINFDYGSWLTPKSRLQLEGLQFKDIRKSGFIDMQLLWQAFNRPVCLTIGAGSLAAAHIADEFVEIDKLSQLPQILLTIIKAL